MRYLTAGESPASQLNASDSLEALDKLDKGKFSAIVIECVDTKIKIDDEAIGRHRRTRLCQLLVLSN